MGLFPGPSCRIASITSPTARVVLLSTEIL
jgi:hypothetical protein